MLIETHAFMAVDVRRNERYLRVYKEMERLVGVWFNFLCGLLHTSSFWDCTKAFCRTAVKPIIFLPQQFYILLVYLILVIFVSLFYYLIFFYYLWVLLYFLVLFFDFIILFQLIFIFIYSILSLVK